ncbi:tetratricopeptide repeat protein [Microcella sp.]|uniref:tetratricopeptide repeat protein n=1 Tax=Microcella sp. TaxID=1913979 RepID=UPI002562E49A|nr:tetratricopeptide repeat protein [Microcella sp.]
MAFSESPDAGLALLDTLQLDAQLGEYHLLHATRADLLRRLGRPTDALPHYRRALELAPSDPERRFLQRRIDDRKASESVVLHAASSMHGQT